MSRASENDRNVQVQFLLTGGTSTGSVYPYLSIHPASIFSLFGGCFLQLAKQIYSFISHFFVHHERDPRAFIAAAGLQAYIEFLVEKVSGLYKNMLQVYLQKSAAFVRRLNKLVLEPLDVSKANKEKIKYEFRSFGFRRTVERQIETFQRTAPRHAFSFQGEFSEYWVGYPEGLEQVKENLLSNAVEYSPNGGTITLYCERPVDNLVVSVRDEGLGIPDSTKEKYLKSMSDRLMDIIYQAWELDRLFRKAL